MGRTSRPTNGDGTRFDGRSVITPKNATTGEVMARPRSSIKRAYMTTDGKTFAVYSEAQAHQRTIAFTEWCVSEFNGTTHEEAARAIATNVLKDWNLTRRSKK